MLLLGIYQPSLVNQKHKMGWFLLRFLDLFRVYCLHIISRNHSNTLLLNDLQNIYIYIYIYIYTYFSLCVYRDFCFIHLHQGQSFQFLGTVLIAFLEKLRRILNITNDYCALNNFVFWFENGFLRVKPS